MPSGAVSRNDINDYDSDIVYSSIRWFLGGGNCLEQGFPHSPPMGGPGGHFLEVAYIAVIIGYAKAGGPVLGGP